MPGFGFNVVDTVGFSISVSADGRPEMKQGGITLDWTTFAVAFGADPTLADGVIIHAGDQYCRYGQVLSKIISPANDTITISATGGTFTVTVTNGNGAATTGAIAFNATAATLQTALAGLSNVGAGLVTVTGSAGGPYSVGFDASLGATTLTTGAGSLTGGSGTAVVAQNLATGDIGKYGPYDPAASDGRALLTPGQCFIAEKTVRSDEPKSDYVPVLYGGLVFLPRIIQSGVATHSLALGPTLAELQAAFPRLAFVND
jgi:hypothetical protein